MPTYFSSQPLGDVISIGSSNILPHSLLLLTALSAVFFFFPMYAWILLESGKGAQWGFVM